MQELISSVESRAEVVGKNLEEINGWFDRHRGEINCLKIREKEDKEEVEKLCRKNVGGIIIRLNLSCHFNGILDRKSVV